MNSGTNGASTTSSPSAVFHTKIDDAAFQRFRSEIILRSPVPGIVDFKAFELEQRELSGPDVPSQVFEKLKDMLALHGTLPPESFPTEKAHFEELQRKVQANYDEALLAIWPKIALSAKLPSSCSLAEMRDYLTDTGYVFYRLAVKQLDLSGLGLKVLPPETVHLGGLRELNLDHNQLRTLPKNVSWWQPLTHLSLAHNEFSSFPENLIGLKHLESLDFSHNQLPSLPFSIEYLRQLKSLNLSHNRLSCLPFLGPPGHGFSALTRLHHLDLRHNQFPYTPHGIPTQVFALLEGNPFQEDKPTWKTDS